jgi:hypothetical protein
LKKEVGRDAETRKEEEEDERGRGKGLQGNLESLQHSITVNM